MFGFAYVFNSLSQIKMNSNTATIESLSAALVDARTRTLALVEGLNKEQLIGSILPTVNPLHWEIAHAAYFHEYWVLRHLGKQAPIFPEVDKLFDSISIQHDDRWQLSLPSLDEIFSYMHDVLNAELFQLRKIELTKQTKYFYLLAIFHEDMHTEAFMYTHQTFAYPKLNFTEENKHCESNATLANEDIKIPGGTFMLGAERDSDFVFDNEKWAHKISVAPFTIAKFAVSNEEYLNFVEAEGYQEQKYWDDAGWKWRCENNIAHPIYWKKDNKQWYARQFDEWLKLSMRNAVIHISWYEANAYCIWANRRLPTEVEWEFAAACDANKINNGLLHKRVLPWGETKTAPCANLDSKNMGPVAVDAYPEGDSAFGCRQMIGNVWEWTASDFQPYPGFSSDCYTEYSRPLFDKTKVLRGGAWTTRARMLRNTWRNYYSPDRNDIFAGFRTCAK